METSAANTVGVLKNKNKHRHHTEDPLIVELSEKQKALRLRIYQNGQSEDRSSLRKERNSILRNISKHLKELEIMRADCLANDISSTFHSYHRQQQSYTELQGPSGPDFFIPLCQSHGSRNSVEVNTLKLW